MSLETFLPVCDTRYNLTWVVIRLANFLADARNFFRTRAHGGGGLNGGQGGESDGECGQLHVEDRKNSY